MLLSATCNMPLLLHYTCVCVFEGGAYKVSGVAGAVVCVWVDALHWQTPLPSVKELPTCAHLCAL